MRFRKLRIAWSVGCGIACVLLIVLWVRSYYYHKEEASYVFRGKYLLALESLRGELGLMVWGPPAVIYGTSWSYASRPVDDSEFLSFWEKMRTRVERPKHVNLVAWGFRLSSSPGNLRLLVPHWSLVLLAAMFVVVPWLPWWSKRFSLRTMLIATTLVALVLGAIVWAIR
jgi:hypothetical protein